MASSDWAKTHSPTRPAAPTCHPAHSGPTVPATARTQKVPIAVPNQSLQQCLPAMSPLSAPNQIDIAVLIIRLGSLVSIV